MSLTSLAANHVQMPRNLGPLENPTVVGRFGSEGGGPFVTLWLVVESRVVKRAAYQTYGCPSAIACASLTCELASGRSVEKLPELEPEDLVLILGGLPEGKGDCATMAINALRNALQQLGEEKPHA